MKKLALFVGFLICSQVFSLSILRVLGAKYRNLSQKYVQWESFKIEQPARVLSVIYGNQKYGFFETSAVERGFYDLRVEMIPPGYEGKIDFFAKTEEGLVKMGSRKFKNPTPKLLRPDSKIEGKGHSLYLGMGNALRRTVPIEKIADNQLPLKQARAMNGSSEAKLVYVTLLNRFGEVVWAHVSGQGRRPTEQKKIHLTLHPLNAGELLLAQSGDLATVEWVGLRGNRNAQMNGESLHPSFTLSPAVLPIDPDRVLISAQFPRFFRNAFAEVLDMKIDELVEYSRKDKKVRRRWSPSSMESPARLYFQQSKANVSGSSGEPLVPFEVSSLKKDGDGFLVAFPKRDRVVRLNAKFKKDWAMGTEIGDDRSLPSEVQEPWSVQRLQSGNLLLLGRAGQEQVVLVEFNTQGKVLHSFYKRLPEAWSGSAEPIPGGYLVSVKAGAKLQWWQLDSQLQPSGYEGTVSADPEIGGQTTVISSLLGEQFLGGLPSFQKTVSLLRKGLAVEQRNAG